MLRKWGMVVFMLLAAPAFVFAQNTGKIYGVVTDADTGDTLPGASVVVTGTSLGTITDVDGKYFIIGVPVGAYDVQASFVGYQTATRAGVDVSTGYSQEVNFSLAAGVELDEIIVEYERPLIQKDAIGVPKIVSSEEIVNLPVRGAANVAKIQAGVASQEGSGALNIRGGRGSEVTFFIDGVKVVGSASLPQSAIQEQEMVIGNISARYGDAMSGIINITTKSGARKFFGSFEGVTSESLDDFGYNLASVALGGPLVGDKVNFFFAGEFTDQGDRNPRAVGQLRVDDALISKLQEAPVAMSGFDADGNTVYLPVSRNLASGATLPVDDAGNVVVSGGVITASDGTTIAVPDGVDPATINFDLIETAATLGPNDFKLKDGKRSNESTNTSLTGNFTFSVMEDARLRLGGRFVDQNWQGISDRDVIFAPENFTESDRQDVQFFGTWTHYLSNSTFYQLQFDYTDRTGKNFDPRFGDSRGAVLGYSDLESDASAVIRGYKNLSFTNETRVDANGDQFTVKVPTYTYRYDDGVNPNSETIARLVSPPGGSGPPGYFQFHNTQLRFTATATTQIGLHQLEFGGEFEQRTNRSYSVSGRSISRFVQDADGAENLATGEVGVTSFDQLTWTQLENRVGYTGYNFRGDQEVDTEDLNAFVNDIGGDEAYNVAPHEPIYYGGYVQDKIEFRDIVLNLGLRVDVFDNNTRILADRFARLPVERAGELGLASGAIGSDYAVYFQGSNVAGYRDLDGNFYDANGQQVQSGVILLSGAKPNQKSGLVTEGVYKDYKPQVTVMPRIGVSFPVTDQALFFARYGVVAQRPSSNNFSSLKTLSGSTGRINNTALEPEETTEYELGFRQRVGARSALTISGFFRQIKKLVELDEFFTSYPQGYSTFFNKDFGTVKGFELNFDLRRTNHVALNANYTMSFAQGSGSSSTTTSTIVWIDETPPNFISPLDFDQRHILNISFDYRLGEGEGPTIMGSKLLQNMGINILGRASSGRPYTPQREPFSQIESKAPIPSGGINSDRIPWSSGIDIRVDRKFAIGARSSLSAFVWVQNLLDTDNTQGVWRATGIPDDDGFLATAGGSQFLGGQLSSAEPLYRHRNRRLGNFGIPRLTRVGVRLDF